MNTKASNVSLKESKVGGKGNSDLVAKVRALKLKRNEKCSIQWDIKNLEEEIKQELVDSDWFDLLNVNWSKVNKLK